MEKRIGKIVFTASIIMLLSTAAFALLVISQKSIDSNYSVKFSTRGVEGTFSGLDGKVFFSSSDLTHSKVDITLDVNSISTGNETKDKHAKSRDWLFSEKYPVIRFSSTSFEKNGNDFSIKGRMEIHGVVKEIQIPCSVQTLNEKEIFTGSFRINRLDYGITGPGLKGKIVGNEIKIDFKIPTTTVR